MWSQRSGVLLGRAAHTVRPAPRRSAICKAARTYYDVLGIGASASQDEIKSAFRRQAKIVHPDVSQSVDSVEDFKRLKEAYDTLSDERQKAQYDEQLRRRQRQRSSRAAGSSGGGRQGGGGGGGGAVRSATRRVTVQTPEGIWVEFEVSEEDWIDIGGDGDDDDDGDADLIDELEYMAWAATPGNLHSSFQSSWQSNGRRRRAARGRRPMPPELTPLSPEEKDTLLRELPRQARAAARQMFGARLQKLETLEELAELLEAVEELDSMGIGFEDVEAMNGWGANLGGSTRGSARSGGGGRASGAGGGGRSSGAGGRARRPGGTGGRGGPSSGPGSTSRTNRGRRP